MCQDVLNSHLQSFYFGSVMGTNRAASASSHQCGKQRALYENRRVPLYVVAPSVWETGGGGGGGIERAPRR